MTDFISAVTKIEGMIEERKHQLKDMAKALSEAVMSRAKDGKATKQNIEADVKKAIASMSKEDQVEVLVSALAEMAIAGKYKDGKVNTNGNFFNNRGGNNRKKKDAADLFGGNY